MTPVPLRNRKGEPTGEMFTEDDHRRPETTMESLRKLKPAFGKNGTVTAGNASGIVDGGAAVVVMPLDEAQKRNLKPMARIVSWGIAGVDPKIMGSGPVPASRIALKKAGLKLDDIDLIEVNEAFAGAIPRGREGARARSRKGQREWRRDRAWTSAGCDRHAIADHADARAAAPQGEVRLVDGVHRRRPGHRRDRGKFAALTRRTVDAQPTKKPCVKSLLQLEAAWNGTTALPGPGSSPTTRTSFTFSADTSPVLRAIEQGHRTIFDTIYKGSTNKFEVEKIRFVDDSVAIVFVFATLKVVQPGLPPQINARPTLIAERRDGGWKIVTFQNTMVTPETHSADHRSAWPSLHPIKGQAKAGRTVTLQS